MMNRRTGQELFFLTGEDPLPSLTPPSSHLELLPHSFTSVQPPPCYRRRRNFWKRLSPLPWSPPPIELSSHYPAAPRASIAEPLPSRASCLHRTATVPPRLVSPSRSCCPAVPALFHRAPVLQQRQLCSIAQPFPRSHCVSPLIHSLVSSSICGGVVVVVLGGVSVHRRHRLSSLVCVTLLCASRASALLCFPLVVCHFCRVPSPYLALLPEVDLPKSHIFFQLTISSFSWQILPILNPVYNDRPRFISAGRIIFNEQEELSQQHINGNNFTDRPRFSNSSFRKDPSSGSTLNTSANPWDRPIGSANKLVSSGQEGLTYDDNSGHGFLTDIFAENAIVDDTNLNPLEFLASLFPGFAAESLVIVTLVSIQTLLQVYSFRTGCY
ncbi:hypothetical protein Ahy_A10g048436 isoform A [Arachis hypogaea]|uniref:Uncharacterized protein n=1 Tax=Arachis hypogaea TaxID=3818 RepID=A0A445B540_ARAHY|nr:hypothetical protein Ahy_A10g048436 isoform A [Arachis hypogaea]